MPTAEIFYSDLNPRGQKKIKEIGLYHDNIDICPVAIIETEQEDFLYDDDLVKDYLELSKTEFLSKHVYLDEEIYDFTDRIYKYKNKNDILVLKEGARKYG